MHWIVKNNHSRWTQIVKTQKKCKSLNGPFRNVNLSVGSSDIPVIVVQRIPNQPRMEDIFKELYEEDDIEEIQQLLQPGNNDRTRGSRPGCAANIYHDHRRGATHLFEHYLILYPTRPGHIFSRRFCMSRSFFIIYETLERNSPFFQLRKVAMGLEGLNCFQKCTAALRQISNGVSANVVDD